LTRLARYGPCCLSQALLSVSIVCGFSAFTFAAFCLYPPQHRPDVVVPLVIGACLLFVGLIYHMVSVHRLFVGDRSVWKWLRVACPEWCCCCCCGRTVGYGRFRTIDLDLDLDPISGGAEVNHLCRRGLSTLWAVLTGRWCGPDGYPNVSGEDLA